MNGLKAKLAAPGSSVNQRNGSPARSASANAPQNSALSPFMSMTTTDESAWATSWKASGARHRAVFPVPVPPRTWAWVPSSRRWSSQGVRSDTVRPT